MALKYPDIYQGEEPLLIKIYNLLISTKPDSITATKSHKAIWLLRYYLASVLLNFGQKYHSYIPFLTRFFPFSSLYKGSLIHYENRHVRKLVLLLEKIAEDMNIPILITRGNSTSSVYILEGVLKQTTSKKGLTTLEEVFQHKLGMIYIRQSNRKIRIICPIDLIDA